MRKFIVGALLTSALMITAAPAMAQAVGGVAGGVVGGAAAGDSNHTTFNSGETSVFNGAGSSTGSSASGFNSTLVGSNGYSVFGSTGQANSTTTVTPFSVTTSSDHSGIAGGFASTNASYNATVQTFGQSNGTSAFNFNQTTYGNATGNHTDFEVGNVAFAVVGFAGFGF